MKYRLDKPDLNVNLAPMIDVVFLLLIFFIVASTLNMNEVETTINLPDTKVVKKHRNSEIIISVTNKGEIYVGEKKISLSKLQEFLLLKINKNSQNNSNISIYADKGVTFQKVISVMDVVKKLEVDNLSFVLRHNN